MSLKLNKYLLSNSTARGIAVLFSCSMYLDNKERGIRENKNAFH